MKPSEFFGIRTPVPSSQKVLLGIVPLLAVLTLWWLVTLGEKSEDRVVSSLILPSPLEVVGCIKTILRDGHLVSNSLYSLGRVVGGFIAALLLALPLGILMGSFSRFQAMFNPVAIICGYLPIAALVPLTIVWFGIGEAQKIAFLAMGTFAYLLPIFGNAVGEIDDVYLQTAYTLGASRFQIVGKVLIPIALPEIFNAMRLSFGIGWTYIILAELIEPNRGLGGLIMIARRRALLDQVFLVLLVIILMAFLVDQAWANLGRVLFPYRKATR